MTDINDLREPMQRLLEKCVAKGEDFDLLSFALDSQGTTHKMSVGPLGELGLSLFCHTVAHSDGAPIVEMGMVADSTIKKLTLDDNDLMALLNDEPPPSTKGLDIKTLTGDMEDRRDALVLILVNGEEEEIEAHSLTLPYTVDPDTKIVTWDPDVLVDTEVRGKAPEAFKYTIEHSRKPHDDHDD